MVKNRSL